MLGRVQRENDVGGWGVNVRKLNLQENNIYHYNYSFFGPVCSVTSRDLEKHIVFNFTQICHLQKESKSGHNAAVFFFYSFAIAAPCCASRVIIFACCLPAHRKAPAPSSRHAPSSSANRKNRVRAVRHARQGYLKVVSLSRAARHAWQEHLQNGLY